MPPKQKKQKTAVQAKLTPKDAYFARLDKALEEHNGKGSMLIMGIQRDSEDSEDSEDEDETTEYTAEQIAALRHIIINDSRAKAIEAGHSFASCGQSEGGFCMFNTSSGNQVIFGIPGEIKKALKKPTVAGQFDALFGLTHGLKEYDCWMHDNEYWEPGEELEKAIKKLAKAWKDTLKKGDLELGIDSEFTRPGIESLLEQFEGDLEECEVTQDFRFKWRP